MAVARSKEEFERAAAGLPTFEGVDLEAEVVCVEPVDAHYFRDASRQRCIIRRRDGALFVTFYD